MLLCLSAEVDPLVLVYFWNGALFTILSVFLAFLVCMMNKRNSRLCTGQWYCLYLQHVFVEHSMVVRFSFCFSESQPRLSDSSKTNKKVLSFFSYCIATQTHFYRTTLVVHALFVVPLCEVFIVSHVQGNQNGDSLHFVALTEIKISRSRKARDDTWSECVYFSVKQQSRTCFIFVSV